MISDRLADTLDLPIITNPGPIPTPAANTLPETGVGRLLVRRDLLGARLLVLVLVALASLAAASHPSGTQRRR